MIVNNMYFLFGPIPLHNESHSSLPSLQSSWPSHTDEDEIMEVSLQYQKLTVNGFPSHSRLIPVAEKYIDEV